MKLKKAISMLLCSTLFLASCSQGETSEVSNDVKEIETSDAEEVKEVEEVEEIKEIDLSKRLSVIGNSAIISIEQAEAFANVIDSLNEVASKATFFDGGNDNLVMLLYTYNEMTLMDSSKIEDPIIHIVQWNDGDIKINSQIDGNYITDLAINNDIYSIVYQKDLRKITDVPNGLSYFRLGFEDGILQDVPEFYSITLTNANLDPVALSNGNVSYTTWEKVFEEISNLDLVNKMVSYDEFYNMVTSTSKSLYEMTHYKIENSTVTQYNQGKDNFGINSEIDSSVLDLTNSNSSYWNDVQLVLDVLTSKGYEVQEIQEVEIGETEAEMSEAELIESYKKVFDVYAKIREIGYFEAEDISDSAGMWSYNLILDDIRYSSTVARHYLDKGNNNYGEMRYDFVDINDDGMKELFILSEGSDGYDGVWGVYSIYNDDIVSVLFGEERTHITLTSNLELIEYGSGGYDSGNIGEFKLENGILDCVTYVSYSGTDVHTSPFENGEIVYGEVLPIDSSEKDRLLDMEANKYKFDSRPLSDIIS